MLIVIDKESLITVFTVALYAICGGDYIDVKNTVTELLEKVKYTELPKGHGRLIDADEIIEQANNMADELDNDFTIADIEKVGTLLERVPTILKVKEEEHMREMTPEETKAYNQSLDKIYEPIGVNVFDVVTGENR